jgi:hypothetical protein
MNKKDIKYIKQIADRLPVVFDQTVSGYYEDYNEEGEMQVFPNIVNHPVNHVRRMRKAYESLGMEGIRTYLEMIHKLQIQRNENFRQQELSVVPEDLRTDTGSLDTGTNAEDPVLDKAGESGAGKRKRRKGNKGDN